MPLLSKSGAEVAERCGCPEQSSSGLTRRGMFQLAGITGLTVATTASQARVALGAPGTKNPVLVVLSLRGGMDGLNLVAPVGDPNYAKLRPSIGVPAGAGLKLDQMFALHPAMKPILPLWQSKKLAIVHATGMPAANRSHFSAMAEMEVAAQGSDVRTGWIDRMIGLRENPATMAGTNLGSARIPQSLRGPTPAVGVAGLQHIGLQLSQRGASLSAWKEAMKALHDGGPEGLSAPIDAAFDMIGGVGNKASAGKKAAGYPDSDLGKALADVAQLVRIDVGVQVATLDMGQWDMHAGMGTVGSGWMVDNAGDLATALAAFAKDLGPDLDRVTLITLSEFGRRAEENGSGGVDHGYGNASFVLGGGVNGGKVYGRWPSLKPEALVQGDLAVTTDYRAVLAEILKDRMDVSQISNVFPDYRPTDLGLIRA
jgi:uncharacterized protein (DUF1501 family)